MSELTYQFEAQHRIEQLPACDGRSEKWQEAVTLWLMTRRSKHTRTAYLRSLRDCLACNEKPPWEISRSDVANWVAAMKKRGLRETTISQSLAAVSSFYAFVESSVTQTDREGNTSPLHKGNPADAKSLRPKIDPYSKSSYLSIEETRALLKTINRKTVRGRRDYALILGYLFTGRRNTEWRSARWGDFREMGRTVKFHYRGKGGQDQKVDIPPPLWQAILDMMPVHNGRAPDPDEYLFRPMTENALHFPNVTRKNWDPFRPISSREALRILKVHAKHARLNPKRIKVHTLRHTAAMLRKQAGEGIEDICKMLGHRSVSTTQIYLHTIEGKSDQSWALVADFLKLKPVSNAEQFQ